MQSSSKPKVAVLLSSYNGAKYIAEQLDSVLQQTYPNILIVIRDDGSTDATTGIIEEYSASHPEKIHIVNAGSSESNANLGPSGGFSYLMQYVLDNKAELNLPTAYMMFCDQDDVWFKGKIEQQMQQMLQLEAEHSSALPILVHSDLQVVAEDKSLISRSLHRYQGLETKRNRFHQITVSNLVTGCTALINEALAIRALPVPELAIMHDWWLAMVASAFGRLEFIDQPLVYYRQHGENAIGAKQYPATRLSRIGHIIRALNFSPNIHLQEVARQAAAFVSCYGSELSKEQLDGLHRAEKLGNPIGLLQRVAYRRARAH